MHEERLVASRVGGGRKFIPTGEGISCKLGMSRTIDDMEVEVGDVVNEAGEAAAKVALSEDVLQRFMVTANNNGRTLNSTVVQWETGGEIRKQWFGGPSP